MRYLYSLMMYFLAPFLLLRLWWKGRKLPAYRQHIGQRFASFTLLSTPIDLWIHAVSLGEVIAASPLINLLLERGWHILLTTTTPTGAERAQAAFGKKIQQLYLPYDLPITVRRFFKKVKPRLGLIMETELWPNLINEAHKQGLPLLLINARLSENSYQGYKKIRWLMKPLLQQFRLIFTQTPEDAVRFRALGAVATKVKVLGNMKFDLQLPALNPELGPKLKLLWGQERTIIIFASTHENEEEMILMQWKKLKTTLANLLLLIAPRHPERFQTIYQLAKSQGFNTGLRSQIQSLNADNEVVILDSLGELLSFYSLSDYAFVGGSLVPVGGHNVLEPIAMKIPVFSGPFIHNFKAIFEDLQEAKAITVVKNADDLTQQLLNLHANQQGKARLIENATKVLNNNKGVVQRYLKYIESFLGE